MGAPIHGNDEETPIPLKVKAKYLLQEWVIPMALSLLIAGTLGYLVIQFASLKHFTSREYVTRYSIDVQDPLFPDQMLRLDLNFKDSTFAAESSMQVFATIIPQNMTLHKHVGSYIVTLVGTFCSDSTQSDYDKVNDCQLWLDLSDNDTHYRESRYATYYKDGTYPVIISAPNSPNTVRTQDFVKIGTLDALQTFELSRVTNNINITVGFSTLALAAVALALSIKYRKY